MGAFRGMASILVVSNGADFWGGRFGWTNASYLYGLSLMSLHAKRALGVNADYETYAEAKRKATEA